MRIFYKTTSYLILRLLSFLFLALSFTAYSQIPAGYYDNAMGREGEALREALHYIIKDHTIVSYTSLWTHFQSTDKKSNGKVWCMYSDKPGLQPNYEYSFGSDQCGNYSGEGDCYNREHSWPENWYGDNGTPMKTDLFHVYPTDGFVNGQRGNHPFGEVGSVSWIAGNGGKLGTSNYQGWSGFTVFEPINEYKGDFARTYFYMVTRYYGQDAGWAENQMVDGANIKDKPLEMLLKWHEQDPVSQKEIDRNNAVYSIQGNRNPFIDHPIFAEAIWDPEYSSMLQTRLNYNLSVYPNPASDNINIAFYKHNEIKRISIVNVSGQELIIKDCCFKEQTNIEGIYLSDGIYYIIIQMTDNYIIRERLTIINN
jgi:endonuclease I